jgi:broad specificity phosphatase PhoE
MFLLRHGQSYFNLLFTQTRVDPGIEDPELTPLGKEQAEAAAVKLSGAELTRVIISPFTRALQTAQPVLAVHRVPVKIMHEVREQAAFACDILHGVSRIMNLGICRSCGGIRASNRRGRPANERMRSVL